MSKKIILISFLIIALHLPAQDINYDKFVLELKHNLKTYFSSKQEKFIFVNCQNSLIANNYYNNLNTIKINEDEFQIDENILKIYNELNNLNNEEKCKLKYIKFLIHDIITKSEESYNFPKELEALPIALSSLNRYYTTPAGAYGIWAVPFFAALKYGYVGDAYHDNRIDLKFSTMAAVKYLEYLYSQYKNWDLAIAAYITSPIYVNNLIKNTKDTISFPSNYTTYKNRLLALILWFYENPIIEKFDECPQIQKDTVIIKDKIHFEQISSVLGINLEDLKRLNPVYTGNIIDGRTQNKTFYLPVYTKNNFITLYDSIKNYNDSIYFPLAEKVSENGQNYYHTNISPGDNYDKFLYKIISGDNLSSIAEKFGVKVSDIQTWNNIEDTKIFAGQEIIIWIEKGKQIAKTINNLNEDTNKLSSINVNLDKYKLFEIYEVKPGDSAYKIAQKYDWVNAEDILEWNNIDNPSKIQIGQKLKIYKKINEN